MIGEGHIKKRKYPCYVCLGFLFAVFSCTKDQGILKTNTQPVGCQSIYCVEIQPILNSKCALSGCHVENFPFGNLSAYEEVKARIDNGKLNSLVFEYALMPPANAVKLSDVELKALKSWIDNGANEN